MKDKRIVVLLTVLLLQGASVACKASSFCHSPASLAAADYDDDDYDDDDYHDFE
jgi:hypothetical protein